MKKVVVLFLLLCSFLAGFAQPIITRTYGSNTVSDPRLMAKLNFFSPRYADTTAANVQKGIDSCGAMIYTYDVDGFWYRQCFPKQWVRFSGGSSGWGLTGNASTNPSTNFIGTTDNQEFVIKTNNSEVGRFSTNGNFSFGQDASATGVQSIAMGSVGTRAYSNYSNVIGTGVISRGDVSTVIGNGLTGRNYGSTTLGNWNDTAANITSLFFADDSTNDLFVIGNGRANNARHNALTILQSGKVGINVRHPTATLHVSGDLILDIPGKADGYVLTNTDGYATWQAPSGGGGSGTVASVATGLGLSGGTITTSGTLLVDTSSASILSRQRAAATYLPSSNYIVSETPSGSVNGSNTAFTLANTPITGKEMVFLNGVLQMAVGDEYSISGVTITFITAPETGDKIRVTYIK